MGGDDSAVRLQLWDIAGAQCGVQLSSSVAMQYLQESARAVVVYDITNRVSFETACSLLKFARREAEHAVPIWLVGNKADLAQRRQVAKEDGAAVAAQHDASFLETSAATGDNVFDL